MSGGCAESDSVLSAGTQRVWSGDRPDFSTGDISPDGRYLSDIDWISGDLRLVDLTSGQAREVTGKGYDAGRYAWSSAFSTDGRRLAVSWYVYSVGSHELRVMNLDGTDSRVLVPAAEGVRYVDPVDWSPTDEEILVALQRSDRRWRIGLVSVADGSIRTLKTLSWLAPGGEQTYPNAYMSPDGEYVAYDYRPDMEGHPRDIHALAVDGSYEGEITSGPATDRFLGWMPDGHGILFLSDRTGSPAVWRLPMRNGRPNGEPELVDSDVERLTPLGFTEGGYAYGATVASRRVHTGAIDPDAGRIVALPQPVDDPPSRRSLSADWSPDGSRLAYFAHAPLPTASEILVIRSADGRPIREVPLSPVLHTSSATLKWVGEEAIFLFAVERGRNGIYRMDPRDGTFVRLPVSGEGLEEANLKWFEVGPEGHLLYLVRSPARAGGASELLEIEVDTGDQRVIGTASTDPRTLAVSPDGDELAFVARADEDRDVLELRVMSTSQTGAVRVLHRAPRGTITSPLAWTPDGARLLFSRRSEGEGRVLWSVAADGSDEPIRVGGGDWCCEGHDIRVHPDGRRIALVAGSPRGEIRVLEGSWGSDP